MLNYDFKNNWLLFLFSKDEFEVHSTLLFQAPKKRDYIV
jgi:hypothetical protein